LKKAMENSDPLNSPDSRTYRTQRSKSVNVLQRDEIKDYPGNGMDNTEIYVECIVTCRWIDFFRRRDFTPDLVPVE